MKCINQTAILEYIRVHGMASRVELAKYLGLSLPSVVRIIDDLVASGVLCFSGKAENSGGRRRQLIEMDRARNVCIAVVLRITGLHGVIVDLEGQLLAQDDAPYLPGEMERSLEGLEAMIDRLISMVDSASRLRGIAVAVPGVVRQETGVVQTTPSLGWGNVPLRERLQRRFSLPVVVDNDVNMAALGELWFGDGERVSNLVILYLGTGLGAGTVMDGTIYRGANNWEGKLSHLVFDPSGFRRKRDRTTFGPIESDVAGVGLLAKLHEALRENPHIEAPENPGIPFLFEQYRAGAGWAQPIGKSFLDTLARVVIALSCVHSPETIVLSGPVMEHAEFLLGELRERLYDDIQLTLSALGERAIALGGAVNVIYHAMDYCTIRSMY